MPKLVNYHEKSIGANTIAKNVEGSAVVKGLKLQHQIHLIGLSSEHGVDVSLPPTDCSFRKVLVEKGYSVARRADQNDSSIGLSINMRKNRTGDAEKIVAAYLLYKNAKLANANGELIS